MAARPPRCRQLLQGLLTASSVSTRLEAKSILRRATFSIRLLQTHSVLLSIVAGQYSFFRFYWKYLIFAVVSFFVCDLIALIFSSSEGALYFFFAMMFISPIVILIVGAVRAGNRRIEENNAILSGNQRALQQRKDLIERTSSLKKDLASHKRALEKDEYQIPTSLRKASSMTQILMLLRSGKASNLTDAYRILGK